MKSNLISVAVLSVTAITSVVASAEVFNPYLFEQMRAPATKSRAEVKAELLQTQGQSGLRSTSEDVPPSKKDEKLPANNVGLKPLVAPGSVQAH